MLLTAVALAALLQGPDDQCRQQWADLGQLHGENGNPRGPVPALNQRWEQLDDEADRYAAEATADDCGATIDAFADQWGALESFQYDLYSFDARAKLAGAEGNRRHYLNLGNHMTPELNRAFREIRHQTPGAIRDLAPALEGAEDVDVQDDTEVREFLRQAREVKRASIHVQRMRHPYRVIGNAELDEE
jgi:hypothetical protein